MAAVLEYLSAEVLELAGAPFISSLVACLARYLITGGRAWSHQVTPPATSESNVSHHATCNWPSGGRGTRPARSGDHRRRRSHASYSQGPHRKTREAGSGGCRLILHQILVYIFVVCGNLFFRWTDLHQTPRDADLQKSCEKTAPHTRILFCFVACPPPPVPLIPLPVPCQRVTHWWFSDLLGSQTSGLFNNSLRQELGSEPVVTRPHLTVTIHSVFISFRPNVNEHAPSHHPR